MTVAVTNFSEFPGFAEFADFRFGIISDLHIALPETIQNHPSRFHLVEVSIPGLEKALEHLVTQDLDFLLLPGDLTQDGEIINHQWLANRLAQLPFPTYVIPGNHDIPNLEATADTIAYGDFPGYYQQSGYSKSDRQDDNQPDHNSLDYTHEILPGVQLVALNSNNFNSEGQQRGYLTPEQLQWLEKTLQQVSDKLVLLTIHHNIIEHFPNQTTHPLGQRYMLKNAGELLALLEKYRVKLILTGHLHVQDIAQWHGIHEICTGSLVSYPHPYRVVRVSQQANSVSVEVASFKLDKLDSATQWTNLSQISREWMGDRSEQFMLKLLTLPPLNLSLKEAKKYAPQLRYFWCDVAAGDADIDYPDFPPSLRKYFQGFSARDPQGKPALIDNNTTITL